MSNQQTPLKTNLPPIEDNFFKQILYKMMAYFHPENWHGEDKKPIIISGIAIVVVFLWAVSLYWGQEPDTFNVKMVAEASVKDNPENESKDLVVGYVSTYTLIHIANTLLDKKGGYLSNDVILPSVIMDDIPSWEFGVVKQIRDFAEALRDDISRSQTQSQEDKHLSKAEPQFKISNNSWMLPATESEYKKGIKNLHKYLDNLEKRNGSAMFFSRADNLRDWFKTVEKRLGSLSQRLSASIRQTRVNTDLAGEAQGESANNTIDQMALQTPWLEIDNVFYEARGTAWALLHLLRAIEIDFHAILKNKNALVSLRQIIRELESTQTTVWSPLIMNGSEFGLFANHSLVMSSYISRANAMIIDLRSLLAQG